MSYIRRHLQDKVCQLSKSYSAILITGPRQSGKTTMLRELAVQEGKNRAYVSLDDLEYRDMAKNDPGLFLQIHQPPLVIDEVQYAPELFTYIKINIDAQGQPGDFWLTGSQVFPLMRDIQESLAGRVALLHMLPLSQREITKANCRPFTTNFEVLLAESKVIEPLSAPEVFQRLWEGGMPGLVSGQFTDRSIYYASYLATYVERDVRDLSGDINVLKFSRFITAVAARTSQLVNYASLAEDADIDQVTAKNWLNILETLGLIFLLHPYSNNVLKRTIKTPKLYFYDTGLVCYLTKWSSPEVTMVGAMSGALLENYAISEIIKSYLNGGLEPFVYYYRDRDNKEIDALLEGDGQLCPLEIKKNSRPEKRLTRVFEVIDKSPLGRGTGAVLCLAEHLGAFDRNNLIVPIWMI